MFSGDFMGKKNLLKSTSKKKTTPKKKSGVKAKAAVEGENIKKTKVAAKSKAVKKAGPKKAATVKKEKLSIKELILKDFSSWKPEKVFIVEPDEGYLKNFVSPPFVSSSDESEIERAKKLLHKKFDLTAEIEKEKEPAEIEKVPEPEKPEEKAKEVLAEKPVEKTAQKEMKPVAEKIEPETEKKPVPPEKEKEKKKEPEKTVQKAVSRKAAEPPLKVKEPEQKDVATYEPPTTKEEPDQMEKIVKYVVAPCIALILLVIVAASFSNMTKFYINPADEAIEIWRGKFAPLGKQLVIAMPGVQAPKSIKKVYSAKEVFPMAFDYYISEADNLLNMPGVPDFNGIKEILNKSMEFAVTKDLSAAAETRLNGIDILVLLYKSDVAASKGTLPDINKAIGYLETAAFLSTNKNDVELIGRKIESLNALKESTGDKK